MRSTLETARLILRPWRESDLTAFHEYCTDPEVGPNAGWKPHESMQESAAVLSSFLKKEGERALVLKENGTPIGSIGVMEDRLEHAGRGRGLEIGYVLARRYWGLGLMPEAVRRIVRFEFDAESADFLSAAHFPENERSRRVIEKCGFRYEKTLPGHDADCSGRKRTMVCYLLTRKDYLLNREFYLV